ncbi:gas vesicle protein [Streptomyces gilvosporeus]|uniref:Gas vesicle protein n=1 Tax=Streptomyces gilvosporeus TaxID=553510 RepID=A0A1V0TM06_9ACTN|nr:gas vesicle protein [Streptomyces gilvosporeus]ARF53933.1 gas vesicle protein [Streptomyces gilvosporeus]
MAAGDKGETERIRRPSKKKTAKKTVTKTATTTAPKAADTTAAQDGVKRAARRISAPHAMRNAAEQLQELLGRAPESVSSVKPTDDGWQADVEVLELERIPETTSVMASYRVTLDEEGGLVAYERTRRYTRGQIDRNP